LGALLRGEKGFNGKDKGGIYLIGSEEPVVEDIILTGKHMLPH